ncbi:MAG TPA: dihydrodipicolinate synthase family protein [Streptosporangiaceae bacterium]|nr:dihydrodipicolinate synthase family protein [Streptosporangiaceae bacterium]
MDYTKAEAKQAARESFTGLWAATTAPFDATGGLDIDALRRDLDRLTLDLEIDGIFCGGVMSEFWSLTGSERRRLVEVVVDSTRGRCPVIAHTGHHSAKQAIELTRHAQKAGADFAVLINPYYPPASDEGFYQWFEMVCGGVDIGVWLFDTAYSGVSLSLELIERLAAIENVCGIKVGRGHARYLEVLARVGEAILVCEPNEGTWLENMRDHGQRAFMSSAAPYLYQTPEWQPMREYTSLALGGDFTGAAQVAATLDPVRALAAKWLHGKARRADSLASVKAWAGLVGMSGGPVRLPLLGHTEAEKAELAADLEAVGLIPGTGSSARVIRNGHRRSFA